MPLALSPPTLQIDFAARLMEARATHLAEALAQTIADLDIGSVDQELRTLVERQDLAALAGQGIRGESVFATPTLLRANPFLLGYYRLLLGYSQKEFYSSSTGLLRFRRCETAGTLPRGTDESVDELCRCLVGAATFLCRGVGYRQLTLPLLDSLTLLTLGPQLRGGANVRRGVDAIRQVMEVIEQIVRPYVVKSSQSSFQLRNATDRLV
ncbi:MAG: XcyI family restriction endonuclease, partial [Planctomycetaceae bacterium]|nr:XcyI family restriction endonuclease [Planctomycetaceae bacterium]